MRLVDLFSVRCLAYRTGAVAAALLLAVPLSHARAQSVSAQGSCGGPDVNDSRSGLPMLSAAITCTQGGQSSGSSASLQNGILRTTANASLAANTSISQWSTARSQASWSDVLLFSGSGVSYVDFWFAVSGTTVRSVGNGGSAAEAWYSAASAQFNACAGPCGGYAVSKVYALSDGNNSPLYLQPSNLTHFDLFSIRAPVSGNAVYVAYQQISNALVNTVTQNSLVSSGANPAMFASSDFGSTGGLTGVTFLDANLQTVSNVTYSFNNGTTFYDPDGPTTTITASHAVVAGHWFHVGSCRYPRGSRAGIVATNGPDHRRT